MSLQRIASSNGRLKSGTEVKFNGGIAWVEHDEQEEYINLRTTKEKQHKEDNTFLILRSEISVAPKYNTTLKVVAKAPTPQQNSDKKDMNAFFDSIGGLVPFNCMNCRRALYAINKPAKRSVSCHILPKKPDHFPELAKDPDNIVFMGVSLFGSSCDDHSRWDASVENRVKMPIYDLVIKRYYEKLRPKLSESQQVKADDYLGITRKSTNLLADIKEGKI